LPWIFPTFLLWWYPPPVPNKPNPPPPQPYRPHPRCLRCCGSWLGSGLSPPIFRCSFAPQFFFRNQKKNTQKKKTPPRGVSQTPPPPLFQFFTPPRNDFWFFFFPPGVSPSKLFFLGERLIFFAGPLCENFFSPGLFRFLTRVFLNPQIQDFSVPPTFFLPSFPPPLNLSPLLFVPSPSPPRCCFLSFRHKGCSKPPFSF